MPAILTTPDECNAWLTKPAAEALAVQRPLSGGALKIVALGRKQDAKGLGQNNRFKKSGSKPFFFEKKKQKLLSFSANIERQPRCLGNESFVVLFFEKGTSFYCFASVIWAQALSNTCERR